VSHNGIHLAAETISAIQTARAKLLAGDTQDILLGQMLRKGDQAMEDDFCRITSMPEREIRYRPRVRVSNPSSVNARSCDG
jgi:hypothetical protein